MKKLISFLLFAICTMLAFAQNDADTLINIKTVTVTAERIFKKEDAGMKATTVDSMIIAEKVNLSLSELLSENTPVFVKAMGRGALATVSFRGTAASHTQVNWNGININNPMSGMVDFSLIPVYIVDDLNLKHGAASAADKSGGLGGSININNKVNWDKGLSFKYMKGIGSYGTFDNFLSISGGNKKLQIKTRAYRNVSENNYTYINRGIGNIDTITGAIINPLDTNDNADYEKFGILQEVYYRPNVRDMFSAKYWVQFADRTIPRATSYEGPDNSNLNNQIDKDHKAVLDWKHFFRNSKLTLRSGYSQKKLDYTLRNFVAGLGMLPAIYSQSTQKSSLNTIKYNYDFNESLSIASSLDFNYHDVASRDSVKKTGYERTRKELSAFVSVRKNFFDRININIMLRQDRVDNDFIPTIPFLGFDFRIFKDIDFLLKGNIARNYHQPSLNDLYWQPGGNPNLLPEKGIGGEIGLEYQTIVNNHLIKTELTLYRSDIDNWIIWIPSFKGYWTPRNIKNVLAQGVELNLFLKGNFKNLKYKLSGVYSYSSSINYGDPLVWGDDSYGKQLVYVPLHSGNLLAKLEYRNFYITYQYNYYSERFTTSSNDFSRRDWLYPYFMNDLILGKKFKIDDITLGLEFKVYNLFNETYHSVLYRPMPGINYMFLMSIAF